MAGSGRKTHYRKHVQNSVLHGTPEPEEGQWIGRVDNTMGGNQLQLQRPDGSLTLAILPTKFRKLVWVRRGGFVIVSESTGAVTNAAGNAGRVTCMVEHVLYKEQVAHLKREGLWPEQFSSSDPSAPSENEDEVEESFAAAEEGGDEGQEETKADEEVEGEGEEDESSEDDESDLFVNRNRAPVVVSSDEETDSDSD